MTANKDHWTLRIPKPKRVKAFLARHTDILVTGMLILMAVVGICVCYIFTIDLLENAGLADVVLNLTPRHLATGGACVAGIWAIKKITEKSCP